MKVPSEFMRGKILLKKVCYNCKHWTHKGTLPSSSLCKKHKENSPVCGYCPLWEINYRILSTKILAIKILEK